MAGRSKSQRMVTRRDLGDQLAGLGLGDEFVEGEKNGACCWKSGGKEEEDVARGQGS